MFEPIFRESLTDRFRRYALGAAYALHPLRVKDAPGLCAGVVRDLIKRPGELPDPETASSRPEGFCGVAFDLSVPALIDAYGRGLYPFSHLPPQKWWSPRERCVLFLNETHIAKRLRSHMRQDRYTFTFDRAFDDVMRACAAPDTRRVPLTWITPDVMRAFYALHEAGHAHSFEVWNPRGELAGGGYGVVTGGVFVTESRFAREDNTSKFAFMVLNWHLARWGFTLNDNKRPIQNVLDMGFRLIPRAEYLEILRGSSPKRDMAGRWDAEGGLAEAAEWRPGEAA